MFRNGQPPPGKDWQHELGNNRPSDSIERLESRMEQHYSVDMQRLGAARALLALILIVVAGLAYLLLRHGGPLRSLFE